MTSVMCIAGRAFVRLQRQRWASAGAHDGCHLRGSLALTHRRPGRLLSRAIRQCTAAPSIMVVRPNSPSGSKDLYRPLLSQTAEYALRAMTILAKQTERNPVSAAELAAATGVPRHYLSKILRRLVTASLLVAQRGHRGGFSLARPAKQIRFSEILDAVGHTPNSTRCAFGWGQCSGLRPCPLHPAYSRLNRAVLRWLEETSLAEVVQG